MVKKNVKEIVHLNALIMFVKMLDQIPISRIIMEIYF